MRKFNLSIFIVLLVFSVCAVTVCAGENENINLLTTLGALNEEAAAVFNGDEIITRGEFAAVLSSAAKLQANGAGEFKDVGEDNPYHDAISKVSSNGYMNGDGNGNFKPDAEIKEIEALVVILRVLGYEEYAGYLGGYPTGYLSVAKTTDITSGTTAISLSDSLKAEKLAILIKNMLNERIYEISSVNGDGHSLELSEKTFLEICYGIGRVKGVVTGNTVTTLEKPAENSGIIIDGRIFPIEDRSYDRYLGYETELYYETEQMVPVAAFKTPRNRTEIITSEEITDRKDFTFYLEDDKGTRKEKSIPSEAFVIYNGKAVKSFRYELLDIETGDITLTDNNSDGKTDVVFIKAYETFLLDFANSIDGTLTFLNGDGIFGSDDLKDAVFYDNGKEIDISRLHNRDVLNILRTSDGKVSEVERSGELRTKKVAYVSIDDKGGAIGFTDGTENRLHPDYAEDFKKITVGETYLFSTDMYHRAVAYIKEDHPIIAALITVKEAGSFEPEAIIRIYNQNDELLTFTLPEKFNFNGEAVDISKSAEREKVLGALKRTAGNMIEYKLGDDGSISDIFVMELAYSGVSYVYFNSYSNIICDDSNPVFLSMNSKAFYIPSSLDSSDPEDYYLRNVNSIGSHANVSITAFRRFGKTTPEADCLRYKTGGGASRSSMNEYDNPSVVAKVSTAYSNNHGEICEKIVYWHNGTRYEGYVRAEDLKGKASEGDVAYIDRESDGEISSIRVYYDYSEKKLLNGSSEEYTTPVSLKTIRRSLYGTVSDTYDTLYTVSYDRVTTDENNETVVKIITEPHRYPMYGYVFDSSKKETVRPSRITDYVSLKTDPDNASEIFVYSSYMTDYMAVIYK